MKKIGIRHAFVILLFAFLLCVSVKGRGEQNSPADVYGYPEETKPLQAGAEAPKLSLMTAEAQEYDLGASLAQKRTILVFYRGRW